MANQSLPFLKANPNNFSDRNRDLLSAAHVIVNGKLKFFQDSFTLDDNEAHVISFTVIDAMIAFFPSAFFADTDLALMEFYEGGATSGGVPLVSYNHNFNYPSEGVAVQAPVQAGVTIDTPGTLVFSKVLHPGSGLSTPSVANIAIFIPNTFYYIVFTNQSGQNRGFGINYNFGALIDAV